MVPVLPLILFSGSGLKVELHQGTFVIALEDGWIKFAVDSHEVSELNVLLQIWNQGFMTMALQPIEP